MKLESTRDMHSDTTMRTGDDDSPNAVTERCRVACRSLPRDHAGTRIAGHTPRTLDPLARLTIGGRGGAVPLPWSPFLSLGARESSECEDATQ
jgi:hypothetical protein